MSTKPTAAEPASLNAKVKAARVGKNVRGALAIKKPKRPPTNAELLAEAIAFNRASMELRLAVKLLQENERLTNLSLGITGRRLTLADARMASDVTPVGQFDSVPINDPLTMMRSLAESFHKRALNAEAARKFGSPRDAPPTKRLGGRPNSIKVSDDEFIELVYAKLNAGAKSYSAAAREVAIDHAITSGQMRDAPRLRATPPCGVVPLIRSSENRILKIIRQAEAWIEAHPPVGD